MVDRAPDRQRLGAAWTLATSGVPFAGQPQPRPIDAIRKVSASQAHLGENAIGNVGIGAAFGLLTSQDPGRCPARIRGAQVSIALAIVVALVFVIAVLLMGVYQAALSAIYSAALYRMR